MKKSIIASILSVALVLVMVLALVPTTASAANKNAEYNLPYNNVAPKTDGVVNPNEYSLLPFNTVNYSSDEFVDQFDKDHTIQADFYACWDDEAMYLAWVVRSELDAYSSPVYGADALGNMWQHCCVQVMYTPYHPTLAEDIAPDTYTGDYLELGVTMHDGETPIKCVWNASGAQAGIGSADWDFAGNVLDTGDGIEVTYEIKFPWKASGLDAVGNGTVIGLSYVVADQVQFDVNNFDAPQNNMVEWQDCILGGKAPKNLAIVTLAGKKDAQGNEDNSKTEVSQELEGNESVDIPNAPPAIDENAIPESATAVLSKPAFNTAITAGSATVITDLSKVNEYNVKWAATAHLRPTDAAGVYELLEVVWADGGEVVFANEIKEGDIALAVHGDDSTDPNSQSCQDREALRALVAGDKVVFLGYDFENKLYATNAVVYYGANEESDVSEVPDESSEAESSEVVDESSEAESSVATDSSDVSEDKADDKGGNTGLIIGIVVAVVAIVAVVVVVVVLKKKKA